MPITWKKIVVLVIILGMVWVIREVVDRGWNPLEGQIPSVEINR